MDATFRRTIEAGFAALAKGDMRDAETWTIEASIQAATQRDRAKADGEAQRLADAVWEAGGGR